MVSAIVFINLTVRIIEVTSWECFLDGERRVYVHTRTLSTMQRESMSKLKTYIEVNIYTSEVKSIFDIEIFIMKIRQRKSIATPPSINW